MRDKEVPSPHHQVPQPPGGLLLFGLDLGLLGWALLACAMLSRLPDAPRLSQPQLRTGLSGILCEFRR